MKNSWEIMRENAVAMEPIFVFHTQKTLGEKEPNQNACVAPMFAANDVFFSFASALEFNVTRFFFYSLFKLYKRHFLSLATTFFKIC